MPTLEPNPLVTALNEATTAIFDHCRTPYAGRRTGICVMTATEWRIHNHGRPRLVTSYAVDIVGGPWRGDQVTLVEVDTGDGESCIETWLLDNRLERK